MHRRQLIALAACAASSRGWAAGPSGGGPAATIDPFALGVASGSPTPDGFVLWTRLVALAGEPATLQPVRWEIAQDEGMRSIVRTGSSVALPALGNAVHVEVDGLAPDRWYHYRFMTRDAVSATGRTRTCPAPDAMPGRLRFAFASCQRWEHGFYAAWRHLAAEQPDLVLFLGDYIYEYATPRTSSVVLARTHTLQRASSLADYRDRYALHKSDPDLQLAHRSCPWLVTWDDHEFENDYAGAPQPVPSVDFAARRDAAYQAFYENMPLRASALARGLAGLGQPDALRVHQRHAFGRLARFHVLDTRQFRAVQACRDPAKSSSGAVRPRDCPALAAPERSLLGSAQERWLDDGLAADARDAAVGWSVLAQQTLFSPRRYGGADAPVPTDCWDGYPAARQRLLRSVAQHQPRNTLLVGGDVHQNFVCNVHADVDRPDTPVLASEFCGTSVTSHASTTPERLASLVQRNPHIVFANSEKRGYALVDMTPGRCSVALRVLDDVTRPDAVVSTLARFVVEDRRAGVLPA